MEGQYSMNIVYFIDHLRPDGAQFILKQLVEGLGKRGHQQRVICLNDSWDEILAKKLEDAGARVDIIGKQALFAGYGIYKIWRCLKADKYDVAVTLLFASDVIGKAVARAAGVPRVVSNVQTHDEFYAGWQRWLARRTMPLTDLVVLPSDNYRDFVIQEEGAIQEKIITIYNFIQVENYQNPISRDEFFNQLGLSPDTFLIGCAGRLNRQKGYDVFLKAISMINREDICVFIAGVGEEEINLKALANDLGISSQIHWAGYRRDLAHILGALDLFVQPSRYEGMPITVLEAMASGCAIIASAVDGNRELILDGVSGWLVPPGDPDALAKVILDVIENPFEARRRADAARRRVKKSFGEEETIMAWEKALRIGA
jgi:glycosyltransferase involved in cell wall biosynthesis